MGAFVDEAHHGIDAVQQAEAEGFQFQRNIDFPFPGVIAETPAGFNPPLPLGGWRDHFPLPDIFAQHEQNVLGPPMRGEINEFSGAFNVKLTDWVIEVD
jgi:hypothetical protein